MDTRPATLEKPTAAEFELSELTDLRATVLFVHGELDLLTAPRFAARIGQIVQRANGDVIVDLSEVEFIDTTGLQVLLAAQRRLTRRSRRLTVRCKAGPVRRAIELAMLGETLRLRPQIQLDRA